MPLDPKIQQALEQAIAPARTQGPFLSVKAARDALIRTE